MRQLDNVQMTLNGSPGTGTFTLLAAQTPHLTLTQAGAVDGDVVQYYAYEGTASEVGYGTIGGSLTTLTRNLLSSTTGSLINFTSAALVAIVDTKLQNPDPIWASFIGAP